jgi:hypothetical protein
VSCSFPIFNNLSSGYRFAYELFFSTVIREEILKNVVEAVVRWTTLLLIAVTAVSSLGSVYESLAYPKNETDLQLHSALQMIGDDVQHSGIFGFVPRTLLTPVENSLAPQSIRLSRFDGLFPSQQLTIEPGTEEERVTVLAVDPASQQATAIFVKPHPAGSTVVANSLFSDGILPTSTADELKLIGDLNGAGYLEYVTYTCNISEGSLSRSVVMIPTPSTAPDASRPIAFSLVANPNGTPCFKYRYAEREGRRLVTAVDVTLSESDDNERSSIRTQSASNLHPNTLSLVFSVIRAGKAKQQLQIAP